MLGYVVSQLSGHEFEEFQEIMKDREAWHSALHGAIENWI